MTKTALIQKLEESREKFTEAMSSMDVNKVVYTDPYTWRAREIMLNVGYWEYEAAKSLNAFADGGEYFVPNLAEDINNINKETFEKYKDSDYSELEIYFDEGRTQLLEALNRFSDEDLEKEHTAFYGAKSTISALVDFLIDHEQTHLNDIKNVK